jgi:hypothetical protein
MIITKTTPYEKEEVEKRMKNKIILESLASDLKRVALGLSRGSTVMANRFADEALKRKSEVEIGEVKPYLKSVLQKMEESIKNNVGDKKAEDALMYSTLIQNYTQNNL